MHLPTVPKSLLFKVLRSTCLSNDNYDVSCPIQKSIKTLLSWYPDVRPSRNCLFLDARAYSLMNFLIFFFFPISISFDDQMHLSYLLLSFF